MEAEIRRRLSVYFGDIEDLTLPIVPLGVGKDVMLSQLIAVIMGVLGVYSVTVNSPSTSVTINPNQFPELGTVTISMGAPSNE
jgi:phage-related baseplate assembly protein